MKYLRTKKDKLKIHLKINEQVTFKFLDECEFDFVIKEWGAYVTPSMFKRCRKFKLKPAVIKEPKTNKLNLVFVKSGKENLFLNSLKKKNLLIKWLKSDNFKKKEKLD
tara:strand:+ start:505 stop:828 length:324 start_codon:yes stop_codon:yes gene_type:complete